MVLAFDLPEATKKKDVNIMETMALQQPQRHERSQQLEGAVEARTIGAAMSANDFLESDAPFDVDTGQKKLQTSTMEVDASQHRRPRGVAAA